MRKQPIKVDDVYVLPIPIRENGQNHLFTTFTEPADAKCVMMGAFEETFSLMLKTGLTLERDRLAVWRYWCCYGDNFPKVSLHEKVGTTFPNIDFGEKCNSFSEEKAMRTIRDGLICSHQNREPKKGKFGGSARLVFELIPRKGASKFITCVGAPSGEKEWEDLVLELLPYYLLRLIKFKDRQVQDILKAADASVRLNSTGFRPPGMTIRHFAKVCFDVVDEKFPKR